MGASRSISDFDVGTSDYYRNAEGNLADFARKPDLKLPGGDLYRSIEDRVRKGTLLALDAHEYAVKLFADSIASARSNSSICA